MAFGDETVLFGPVTYYRDNGAPFVEHASFDSPCAGPGYMIVENGTNCDGEECRKLVSSANLILNGKKLIIPNDLNQHADYFYIPIELLAGDNKLDVELRSAPGSCLTITIVGEGGIPQLQ